MLTLSFFIGFPLTFIVCYNIDLIMSLFISSENITAYSLSIDYAYYNFLSLFFLYASFVFQGFYTGIEKTKIHMKATLSSNIVNLYLNFGLIFGTDKIIENLDKTSVSFPSKRFLLPLFNEGPTFVPITALLLLD